jgi:hypothetical protein
LAAFSWFIYEWSFVDDGPSYFAADWRRLAAIAVFAIAGGCVLTIWQFFQVREFLAEANFMW